MPRNRWIQAVAVAVVALSMAAPAALADGLSADGDGDTGDVFDPTPIDFGDVCRGETYTRSTQIAIRRAGANNMANQGTIFADGGTVALGFAPYTGSPAVDSGRGAQVVAAAGDVTLTAAYDDGMGASAGQIVLPSPWASLANGSFSPDKAAGTVTLAVGLQAPVGDPNTTGIGSDGTVRWQGTGTARSGAALVTSTQNPTGFQANRWVVLDPASAACNHDPSVRAAFQPRTVTCAPQTLTVTLSDADLGIPGSGEALDVDVDFGDGTTWSRDDVTSTSLEFPHTSDHAGMQHATVTVTDQHGRSASATADATVEYHSSGILQPVNADGSSVFKAGSTVPLKVRYTDCDGSVPADLAPEIRLTKLSGASPVGGTEEAASTSSADTGNQMRLGDGQWIFNLATRSLDPTATYRVTIAVPATEQVTTVVIGLR
jgi:hypothetical protein